MDNEITGLGTIPKSEWPKMKSKYKNASPRELLSDEETHTRVKNYIVDRLNYSEREMSKLKPRWQVNEIKYQAYIKLTKADELLKEMNDNGGPPKVVNIVVPYTFATLSTIVTYLIHTFAGRKPMFQVGSNKRETAESARNMELKLQYDADHTRLIKHLFQFLLDGQQYGVSILRCQWSTEKKLRTVWKPQTILGIPQKNKVKTREERVVYEGNSISSIDPYMFLPDPRVPMSEVNRRGEWVFWKSFEGKHTLKTLEYQKLVFNVDRIVERTTNRMDYNNEDSKRDLRTGGNTFTSINRDSSTSQSIGDFYEIHQGTIEIIPAELGLGESEKPEKWLFTIANKNRIIQAQPLALDHDMHPVVVSEPYTMGYAFGQLGMSDYLGPMQDHMSWLINSHMDNVKTALNNMFVFDPSRIEIQDMTQPGAGKLIRAKKAAYGTDIREAIHQFPVQDVTQGHLRDFQLFMKMGDAMSSITDNLRGMQDSGGRKTATEVRTSGEAGASRLAALARYISAQAITDLTEQMSLNNQQNLSDEFYIEVVGQDGLRNHIRIDPEHLTGDFQYPIHDGTLPLDRVAMLDVWREIFTTVSADEQLRGKFSILEIFKYMAELGGARNIERFELTTAPDEMVQQDVQAGNAVPMPTPAGTTPGINADPSQRIIT